MVQPEHVHHLADAYTLKMAFDEYLKNVIAFKGQSKSTQEHHTDTLNSLIKFLGEDILLSVLTFELVRDWKFWMDGRKLSPLTVRGYLIRLRVVLSYMHMRGIDCLDPELIHLPKRPDRIPEVISPQEVEKMIDATCSLRDKTVISLLYSSGLRVSELCALNRMDVKEDFFPVVGKGGKSRLCFIDERTRKLLNDYLEERTEGRKVYIKCHGKWTDRVRYQYPGDNYPALFVNENIQRLTSKQVQEMFKRTRKKADMNINVHPHTMRHSFATNLLKNGASVYAISKMLGHSSLDTTSQYLHLFDPELKETFVKYHTT